MKKPNLLAMCIVLGAAVFTAALFIGINQPWENDVRIGIFEAILAIPLSSFQAFGASYSSCVIAGGVCWLLSLVAAGFSGNRVCRAVAICLGASIIVLSSWTAIYALFIMEF